jgi:outer membrane protein assembly factor BamB
LTTHQQGIGVWKDRVIVHIGKYVMCFNAQTGVPIWRTIIKGRGDVSPAVGKRFIYMSDSSGHVYALNAETGAIVWELFTAKGSNSSPALVDGVLYVGDGQGHLNAIQ